MKKTKTIGLILLLSISVLIVSDVGTKIHEKSPVDPGDNTNIEMMKPNNAVVNHLTADDSDKFAEAITITPGNYSGHIANGTDNDFYEIELEKGDLIRTELVPQLGSDFDIKLFDPSKTEVAVSSSSESREDDIIAGVSTSGTWYIWVYYSRGYGGTYDLTVDIIENNDGNSGSDAGNDRSTAMAIDGGPIVGTIQREIDEDDYYQFSATSGDMINVTIEWVNFQTTIDILLYDETGSQIAGDTTSVRNSLRKSISLITPDTGFYYIDVRFRDAPSKYYLFVSAGSLNDAGTGSDAGDSNITAHSLSDTYFIGSVSTYNDSFDYYLLNTVSGQPIRVMVGKASGIKASIVDETGSSVENDYFVGNYEILDLLPATGSYYLKLEHISSIAHKVYEVNITNFGQVDPNDAGLGVDAGEDRSSALGITPGIYTAEVSGLDLSDYFSFSVFETEVMKITVTTDYNTRLAINIYDTSSFKISGSEIDPRIFKAQWQAQSTDTFFVEVRLLNGFNGSYSIEIDKGPADIQNDANEGGDADADQGFEITAGFEGYSGEHKFYDKVDNYHFSATAGDIINFTVIGPESNGYQLILYGPDPDNPDVQFQNYPNDTTRYTHQGVSTITHNATLEGIWGIGVLLEFGTPGEYTFTLDLATAPSASDDAGTGRDAGDSISESDTLTNGTYSARLEGSDGNESDFYDFPVSEGQFISIAALEASNLGVSLTLYDPTEAEVSGGSYIQYIAQSTGSYYLQVEIINERIGFYDLEVRIDVLQEQNDAGTGSDASNSTLTATSLNEGTYSGNANKWDNRDYYAIQATEGEVMNITLDFSEGNLYFSYLYHPDGRIISRSVFHPNNYISYQIRDTGEYILEIEFLSGIDPYQLKLEFFDPVAQNDAGQGHDAPNHYNDTDIIELQPNEMYNGSLNLYDHDDYYAFDIEVGQALYINVTPTTAGDFDLRLRDGKSSPSRFLKIGFEVGNVPEQVYAIANSTGTWYLSIRSVFGIVDDNLSYELTVETAEYDLGSNSDAGSTIASAFTISNGQYNGSVAQDYDEIDVYQFNATVNDTLTTVVSTNEDDILNYTLFDPNGQIIVNNKSTSGDLRLTESLIETNGTYHIFVELLEGKITNYDISFSLIPPEVNEEDTSIPLLWLIAGAAGILLVILLSIYIIKRRKSNSQ